ncbi:MAG TPA: hypothetical protein VHX16_03270, partial [Chloroflexota bacterium]|nr:hypothetical protein [Chloroflexota bacterium]
MTIASTPTTLHFRTATPRFLAFASALGAHLALAALVLLAFSDLVTQPGSTVAGHDMTQSFNWESFNRLALSQGYLPWWNPYTLSGMPSLADFQSQLAYPLNLPLRLLPVQAFFTWGIALHVWIAASGVMALCRVIGTGWLPAFIAGAGFALGGVFAPRVHAGHLMLMYGWAWLPVALAVAIVSIRRRSWLPHPALPLVLTLQFLTGHLQTTIYVYAAVGALFLYAWLRPSHGWSLQTLNWRPTSQWAITLALLTGLAAFMLLPTIVLVKELGRTAGLTYEAAARNSWDMLHVLTLFAPEAMNSIRAEPNDSVTGSHWERSAYCGALLALLAPFGLLLARKHRWYAAFFGVLALVALAFAFGRNLPFFQLHYLVLPGLRHAARILPLFSLSVVVLGALGLDALLRRRQSRLSPVLVGLMAAEAIAIGVLGWLLHLDSGAPLAEVLGIGAWLLPIQLGGLTALVLLPQHRGVPLVAATLLSTLLIAELLLYDKPFIQARSIPDLRIVDRLLHRESVDRVVTNCDGVVQPNDMMAL